MLPSLLVAAVVTAPGAPIPMDAVRNTTGPAPRVVAVKADASGAVWITAYVYEMRKVKQNYFVIENGKQVMKQQEVEQMTSNYIRKTLSDFGGTFATAGGTPLSAVEASKRVKDGATMLIAADGKPVDKGWLRAVSDDTVVMMAEGLAHAHFQYNQSPYANAVLPSTATPRLARFCADDKGAVKVEVNNNPTGTNGQVYYGDINGGRIIRGRAIMVQKGGAWDTGGYVDPLANSATSDGKKLLADVKFDAFDVNGKLVPKSEALKRLKAGGMVLLAGDNRFPDEDYLKSFHKDVLVLVSGEFVFAAGQNNPYDMPVKSVTGAKSSEATQQPVGNLPPLLLPAPPVAQVQIAPAVIKQLRVAPAVVVPAPKANPKPAEKPITKPVDKK